MPIKCILLAAGAALALSGATAAEAATRLFTISGGTFSDGTSFTGSFNYDDATNVYSLGAISVAAGTMSAFTYDAGTARSLGNLLNSNGVVFFASSATRYLNLVFAGSLAGSTGPISLVPGNGFATSASYECGNCGTVRQITGGTVSATPAVPEPATWAMMMLGFGGMGYALRRRTKVAARIRFV